MSRRHPPRRRLAPSGLLGAAGALLLAACGDGGTGPDGRGRLSASEARALAASLLEEMALAIADVALDASGTPARGAAGASRLLETIELDAPCRLGGRIAGSLSVTDGTDDDATGPVSGSITLDPEACVVSVGSRTIAVSGDPSLVYRFSVTLRNGEPGSNLVWVATGGMRWDRESCRVDYTITVTPLGTATISGTICGEPVSGSFDGALGAASGGRVAGAP